MSEKQRAEQNEALTKRIQKNEKRQSEVNRLIKKMYEDNISGKLSDKRLADMLKDYEAELLKLEKSLAVDYEEKEKQIPRQPTRICLYLLQSAIQTLRNLPRL